MDNLPSNTMSIGQAACVIGVCVSTMRRWDKDAFLQPSFRTRGGHRRYTIQSIESRFPALRRQTSSQNKKTILYSRVSGHDQRKDLAKQAERLREHANKQGWDHVEISDLGSGLNCKKPGLKKLVKMIIQGEAERLVLSHKDRLLRFGTELIFLLCEHYGVEVTILEDRKPETFYENLTAEIIEIITVSSARLYGRRSHESRQRSQVA